MSDTSKLIGVYNEDSRMIHIRNTTNETIKLENNDKLVSDGHDKQGNIIFRIVKG